MGRAMVLPPGGRAADRGDDVRKPGKILTKLGGGVGKGGRGTPQNGAERFGSPPDIKVVAN